MQAKEQQPNGNQLKNDAPIIQSPGEIAPSQITIQVQGEMPNPIVAEPHPQINANPATNDPNHSHPPETLTPIVLDPPKKESMKDIMAVNKFQRFQKSTSLLLLYLLKAFAFTDVNRPCMWVSLCSLLILSALQVYIFQTLLEKLAITILTLLILSMNFFKLRSFRVNNFMRNRMAFAYMFLFEFSYFYAYYSYTSTQKSDPIYLWEIDIRIFSYIFLCSAYVINGCTFFLLALIYSLFFVLIPFFGLRKFYYARVFTEVFDAKYPRKSKQITIKLKGELIIPDKMDAVCPLCLESFDKAPNVQIMKANCHPSHEFHLECLKYMLIYSKACPFCRKALTDDNIDFTA